MCMIFDRTILKDTKIKTHNESYIRSTPFCSLPKKTPKRSWMKLLFSLHSHNSRNVRLYYEKVNIIVVVFICTMHLRQYINIHSRTTTHLLYRCPYGRNGLDTCICSHCWAELWADCAISFWHQQVQSSYTTAPWKCVSFLWHKFDQLTKIEMKMTDSMRDTYFWNSLTTTTKTWFLRNLHWG